MPRALILARIGFVKENPVFKSSHILKDGQEECLTARVRGKRIRAHYFWADLNRGNKNNDNS